MATVVEHSRLKEFQSRLEKLKAEQSVILIRKKDIMKEEQGINKKINHIKKEIEGLTDRGLIMSEHAIIQLQNRVQLMSSEDAINYVITDELKKLHNILGNGSFPLQNGTHSAVIKNNVVVTVVPN